MTILVDRGERGFSLVELMVGMLLGILLIGGAATIYLTSKRSYVEVEQVAALSENARFAELLVSDSLRHVGHFGEVTVNRVELDPNLSVVVNDCGGAAQAYDTSSFIFAATAPADPDVTAPVAVLNCIDDAVPDTDVLVIKHVIPRPYSDGPRDSADPNNPTHMNGTIDFPEPLSPQKTYVMTNNVRGIVFDGADTAPSILVGGEVPGGVAWEYQFEAFYVRQGDTPTLSRKVLRWDGSAMAMVTENLVEGVENLRLQFGYDSDGNGDVDTYGDVAALTAAGNWDRVESVEVFMLIRNPERDLQYTDIKSYQMGGGVTVEPDERVKNFRRMATHASISLRNMKLMIRGEA